jgi:hypothetical protein
MVIFLPAKKSFVNETKWYKIGHRLKDWVQKIFQTLLPNFFKGLNQSWHKFGSFCIDKSDWEETKG